MGRQSDSSSTTRSSAVTAASCAAAARSAAARSVTPCPRRASSSPTSGPGAPCVPVGLQDGRVAAERNDRGSEPAVSGQHQARRGDGGDGHRQARHGAAAVDEQAQRAPMSTPGTGHQVVSPGRPGPGPLAEGPVQVQITLGPGGAEAAGSPGRLLPGPGQPDEDPRGQPPRRGPQLTVGGPGQVGQQGHGGVGVVGQQAGERLLVELAQPGRDIGERGVPAGQLGPADAPPGRAPGPVPAGRGRRGPARTAAGPGRGPFRRAPAAGGGRRSPFPWPSRDPRAGVIGVQRSPAGAAASREPAGQSPSSSSSSTDSGVRSHPSAIRIRPDSAAYAASRALVPRHPRLAAQPGQASQQQDQVDRAAHRGAHPHVGVLAGGPGEGHRELRQRGRDRPVTAAVISRSAMASW